MYANAKKPPKEQLPTVMPEGEEIYADWPAVLLAGGNEICMIVTYFFEYTKTKKL